ncbi:hypothetical protein O0L34_g17973 [Tuta absoluta]|nr:hypothetical protein O0L34_g17973 [Tuta absoluta]
MPLSLMDEQQELHVEQLHANMDLARGNTADANVVNFWTRLSQRLNQLGCQRNVAEWQHVCILWSGKVKSKARKISNRMRGTGGGPAALSLSVEEEKVIEIIGRAAVYGFNDIEYGLPNEPN